MSFPSDSWKTQLRSASKSCLISISNDTNETLVRSNYGLVSGIWSHFPPETIPPNTTIDFGSHASGFIATSTEGSVQYKCELNTEYCLTFYWTNNVWGKKNFSSTGPPHLNIAQTATTANHSIVSFVVTKNTGPNNNTTNNNNNTNRPNNTTEHNNNNNNNKPSPDSRNSSASSTSNSSANSTPDASPTTSVKNLNAITSASVNSAAKALTSASVNNAAKARRGDQKGQNVWSSGSMSDFGSTPTPTPTPTASGDWKDEMAKATRSVLITIENKTMHTLRRRDQVLKHGVWAIFPPETIQPNDIVTFATRTDGWVAGTEGIIYYSAVGVKGDVSFYWCNPYIGDRSFKSRAPPEIRIEHIAKKKNQASAIFYIIPNDEEEGQLKAQNRKYGEDFNETKATINDNFSVKILTLNTQLLPPIISKNNTEKRARKIADLIIRRKYDIVCLQEVFHNKPRNILMEDLKAEYPYQITKSGGGIIAEGSGLFVASKFPIIKHKFWPFENGVGSDSLCSKGVLGIKLDLTSMAQDKSIYVFVTQLQSNPDGSLPWKLSGVGYEGAIRIRENQLNFVTTKIERTIESEARDGKNIKNMGIILCGDFQTTAENETKFVNQSNSNFNVSLRTSLKLSNNNINEEDVKIIRRIDMNDSKSNDIKSFQFYSEAVKSIANHINQQENNNKIIYSSDIIDMMHGNNIPIEYLGHFRALIKEYLFRERLLFLIEMITYIIKNEIIQRLKAIINHSNNNNMNNTEEIEENEIPLDLNTYRDIVLSYYQLLLTKEKDTSRNSGSANDFSVNETIETDSFWSNFLLERLVVTFPEGLTHEERRSDYGLQRLVFILKFQLLQSLRKATGIMLKSTSVERILQEESSVVTPDDIFIIDTTEPNMALNNFTFSETAVENNLDGPLDANSIFEWRLRKTREYETMLELLSNPRDLFREKNAHVPGYTVNSFENVTEKNKGLKIRIDYIFAFDKILKYDLNRLKVKDCRVLPFGSTPQTQLSGHYSVEAVFSVQDSNEQAENS